MYYTGIFSEFCLKYWDLNTAKWDLEKKMGWEMRLIPLPSGTSFPAECSRNLDVRLGEPSHKQNYILLSSFLIFCIFI